MKIQIPNFKIQKSWWVWLVGVLIALLVFSMVIRWWNRDVVSVKVAKVMRAPIEEVISASGIVNAPVYILDSKLGGKIATLRVKEGDKVWKGQVLAELDNTSRLVAPASGVVAKINYLPGESLILGTPAIVVVNYDQLWIDAQIDEVDIANVNIKDKVKISSDVYPDKVYEGEIYWITPVAELRKVGGRVKMDEESYVFPCKIKILGNYDELKVNMSVNVDIVTKKSDSALVIPREALISSDDHLTVFSVNKQRVFQTTIETGIRSFSSAEVVSGLAENDTVAISNLAKLKNKGRIKIER